MAPHDVKRRRTKAGQGHTSRSNIKGMIYHELGKGHIATPVAKLCGTPEDAQLGCIDLA